MSELLLAAGRDASWFNHPGKAEVRHIAVQDGEMWFARCMGGRALKGERTTPLCDFELVAAERVHPGGRCQRPGCRVKWPAEHVSS